MNDLFGEITKRSKRAGNLHINSTENATDVWLTPPEIIRDLGEFDLDPCAAIGQPWRTAKKQYTEEDDGYHRNWEGRVWLNPPYSEASKWIQKLSNHGNGTALLFARTGAIYWQKYVLGRADALLMIEGRLNFYRPSGVKGSSNAGDYSILIAYGSNNVKALKESTIRGKFIELNSETDKMKSELTQGII